jgi:hypothetical protein
MTYDRAKQWFFNAIMVLFAIGILFGGGAPALAQVTDTLTSAAPNSDPQLLINGKGLFSINGTFSTATAELERIQSDGNWVNVSGGTGIATEQAATINLEAYSVVRVTADSADGSTSLSVEIREAGR